MKHILQNSLFVVLLMSIGYTSTMQNVTLENITLEELQNQHPLLYMAYWETPDLSLAQQLLSLGISVDDTDPGDIIDDNPGGNVLVAAASNGKINFVRWLLDHGANIESRSPWNGATAIMKAALDGYNDILTLLIARGANVNATAYEDRTALIWAAQYGHVESVKILLDAGANPHARTSERRVTALDEVNNRLNWKPQHKHEQYTQIKELLEKAMQTETQFCFNANSIK